MELNVFIFLQKAGRRMLPATEKELREIIRMIWAELSKGLVPCSPSGSETTGFSQAVPCSRDI